MREFILINWKILKNLGVIILDERQDVAVQELIDWKQTQMPKKYYQLPTDSHWLRTVIHGQKLNLYHGPQPRRVVPPTGPDRCDPFWKVLVVNHRFTYDLYSHPLAVGGQRGLVPSTSEVGPLGVLHYIWKKSDKFRFIILLLSSY